MRPGNPSTPAIWSFTPETTSEDFGANLAAYQAAEEAEKATLIRREQQYAEAVGAVVEIIQWAWERNLFCKETVLHAQTEAKQLAPEGHFGSWYWADRFSIPSVFGTFPKFGRCQMNSKGTGRDIEILQAAISRLKVQIASI